MCAIPCSVCRSFIPIPPYLVGPCTTVLGIDWEYPVLRSAPCRIGVKISSHCFFDIVVAINLNVSDGYKLVVTPIATSCLVSELLATARDQTRALSFNFAVCLTSLPSTACQTPSVLRASDGLSWVSAVRDPSGLRTVSWISSLGFSYFHSPFLHL